LLDRAIYTNQPIHFVRGAVSLDSAMRAVLSMLLVCNSDTSVSNRPGRANPAGR